MTTNEQLIQLMQEIGLDTQPDPKLNRDVDSGNGRGIQIHGYQMAISA
jgi:hypothetical protein